MQRVMEFENKEDLMEELPDEATMIVVVYHDKEPMRKKQKPVKKEEEQAAPEEADMETEAGGESDDSLEYMPPSM